MSSWLEIWLTVCAAVSVLAMSLRWLVGPVRLRAKYYSVERLDVVPSTEANLTPEMREFFCGFETQFTRLGFTGLTTWALGQTGAAATGVTAIMSAPTGDTARAVATRSAMTRSNVQVVSSKFWDGSSVVTTNRAIFTGRRSNPRVDEAAFPWVHDAATLVEAHARRLNQLGRADCRRINVPSFCEEREHLQRNWAEEFDWHVKCGYMYHDKAAQKYRLTWKGAALVSWRLTSPVKGILVRRRDRRMRRLWQSLGMDRWLPSSLSATPVEVDVANSASDHAESASSTPLRYETGLQDGELRTQRLDQTLIVRMGGPAGRTAVKRQIPRLLFATVFAVAFGITVVNAWLVWHRLTYLPRSTRWHMMAGPHGLSLWWAILWLIFLALDIWRIVSGIRNARGTVVLSASPAGLAFDNAPDRRGSGELFRADLEGLVLRVHKLGLTGPRHRLEARLFDSSRVVLLVGKDRTALADARMTMLDAMGMTLPSESKSRD